MRAAYQYRLRLTAMQQATLDQWLEHQRKDFHYKTAKKLLNKGKNIGHEALNIKGIARTTMAKSTHDAGWGAFLQILQVKAASAGLMTIAVNPNGTTQDCSGCGQKVPKEIQDRWHSCPHCGLDKGRDHNAAINIKYRAVGHSVLKAQATPYGIPGVTEKPAPYA
jgi:putative transposase